jgi:hypothetical protein
MRRALSAAIDQLEPRRLLAGLPNPLVNEPDVDLTTQDTQSETSTLAFGSTVLVAYNDSGSDTFNHTQATGWSRSTDGGKTFNDLGRLPFDSDNSDGQTGDGGSPVWARDRASGRIYLTTVDRAGSGLQVFRSTDNGLTLQPPVDAFPNLVTGSGDFIDKPWVTVDNAAGAGQGTVYAVGRNSPGGGTGTLPDGIYVSRSTDGGANWSVMNSGASLAGGQVNGANVVVGNDHALYVFWFDYNVLPLSIHMRKSTDGGATFGPDTIVATHHGVFVNGALGLDFRTNSFPQAVVNPANGNLYVIYTDKASSADRGDVELVQSVDGGANWSTPTRVNDDATNNDQVFPTIAVTPDGTHLFAAWYDRRNDPANSLLDIFGATATISGSTISWSPNFRITNTSFPVVTGVDPFVGDSIYMGGYDTASADNSSFYYSWGDNRDASLVRPTMQANVRFARIPLDGPAGPMVVASRPSVSINPTSNVQVDFNRPMNPASFSLADVVSFTGPGGTNLLPQVTGFSWLDADTLQINFAAQPADGAYRMEIGPNIAAASGPATMDQDVDGIAGEPVDDRAIITFTNAIHIGPDAFGYVASAAPFENIDLVAGQPGVNTALNGSEDVFTSIPLGSNTFNFYGTSYTGASQLFVTDNGFLSFGAGATDYTNADLTTTPAPAVIAPLWDDWSVKIDSAAPATNSAVLYEFDTANNRLIVEWSDTPHWENNSRLGPATFQAILQLNTGNTPGTITFNYVDLTVGDARFDNAISATVGLKGTGTQGGQRLVIHEDAKSQYVGEGKAIRIVAGAPDTTPPTILDTKFVNLVSHAERFTFSDNVLPSLNVSDFTVQNLTTGDVVPSTSMSGAYNTLTNLATLTFPGVTSGIAPGILPDGNYRVTVSSAGVTDEANNPLDGDRNGTPGPDGVYDFFVLSGDANHDRTVDLTDFTILASNFNQNGRSYAQGNFSYDPDGFVGLTDFTILAANFNKVLAPPPAASAGTSPAPVDGGGNNSQPFTVLPAPAPAPAVVDSIAALTTSHRRDLLTFFDRVSDAVAS